MRNFEARINALEETTRPRIISMLADLVIIAAREEEGEMAEYKLSPELAGLVEEWVGEV